MTQQERDVESLYDYFGARYYDSRIGRWLAVDPLSEKYPAWSPYVHSAGNPERFVDVDGRVIFEALDVRLSRWYQFARSLMLSTAAGREVWQKLDDRKDIVIFIKFRVFDNPNTTGATNWESMEFNSNERGLTAFDIGDQIVTLGPSHVIRVGLSPLQLHKHSILDASQTLYHELTAHIYYYLANLLPLGLIVREEIEHDWFGDDGLLNHFDKAGNSPAAIYYRQAYVAQWKLRENWKHNTGYLSPRKRYYSYDPFSGEENYTNPEH